MQFDLCQTFDLEKLDTNLFRNRCQHENFKGTIFGGQVLSQALIACYLSQNEEQAAVLPHSMHGYFLRAGKSETPIIFDVENVRDGRTVLSRRVVARQYGQPIFTLSASFHREERGCHHQTTLPNDIPSPEKLIASRKDVATGDQPMPTPEKQHSTLNPFTIIPIEEDLFLSNQPHPANAYYWIKTAKPMPDRAIEHYATLAFASDIGLLATALLPHGIPITSNSIFAASLDHAMWFHSSDFKADEWMLCHCSSPWAGHGRGFSLGSIFTRDGRLILSTAQEGLIRQTIPIE